jgi:serine/threonine protein kinase
MSSDTSSPRQFSLPSAASLESVKLLFTAAWQKAERPWIGHYAELIPAALAVEERCRFLWELVTIDMEHRWRSRRLSDTSGLGASTIRPGAERDLSADFPTRPAVDEYIMLFPELGPPTAAPTKLRETERSLRAEFDSTATIDLGKTAPLDAKTEVLLSKDCHSDELRGVSEHPAHIGRYAISGVLGAGAFGKVYLAHDEQLDRKVAIKIPTHFDAAGDAAEAFLVEARHAGKLRHPGIVTVYDVGSQADGSPYIVMEYVDGIPLDKLIKQRNIDREEAVRILIQVGEAVHFAHQKGLVHRDLKPGNILMEHGRNPRVLDFGLAVVEEEQIQQAGRVAGTPFYMSPELTRGETHRLDGRSDLWSLGVIFYELLTGARPFGRVSISGLIDEIQHREPRPPRQFDDTIPKVLEFVCLKCLTKRVADRYATVADFVQDLRDAMAPSSTSAAAPMPISEPSLDSALSPPTGVIPRGLRSFDAIDADFFLSLLPGPRDRHGLPEQIRFWKSCIENRRRESAQPVCVLYGPSGCGKSSLIKAGVLPRLNADVTTVFVEASQHDTETRLVRALTGALSKADDAGDLPRLIGRIRQGLESSSGAKLLIVIDQFEQWLHGGTLSDYSEIIRGLRQCDGVNVQCLLLVRDDFWMGITRLAHHLELRLVDRENSAPVDLFDLSHATRVVTMFGRAYARLPDEDNELTDAQRQFLAEGIASLEVKGYVSPVLLSLFAEMLKGRPWAPETLRSIGGAQGVAEAYLEDTFCSRTAPLEHRRHEAAARQALGAMLPVDRAEIRGPMVSMDDLRKASGYDSAQNEFAALLRVLDSELRLITPCDPEGTPARSAAQIQDHDKRFFQLTHDVLVPALRRWLTRRKRDTRRGRAELILAERSEQWAASRQARYLPSAAEWARIELFTRRDEWTDHERSTMRHATRRHVARAVTYIAAVGLVTAAFFSIRPSQLEVLANTAAGHKSRLMALKSIDLTQGRQLSRVSEILVEDEDAQLIMEGLRSVRSLAPERSIEPSTSDYASTVRGLCERLLARDDGDDVQAVQGKANWDKVKVEALRTFDEYADSAQLWNLVLDCDGRSMPEGVMLSMIAVVGAIEGESLPEVEGRALESLLMQRLPNASNDHLTTIGVRLLRSLRSPRGGQSTQPDPEFLAWLVRADVIEEGSDLGQNAAAYLDLFSPNELGRAIIDAAEYDNDLGNAAKMWLLPYARLASTTRIDELGDWSEKQILLLGDDSAREVGIDGLSPDVIQRLQYHFQVLALLQPYDSKRREAVYRQACRLLRSWQSLDAFDGYETVAGAFEALHDRQSPMSADKSLIDALDAAITESENQFTRIAAVRALFRIEGLSEGAMRQFIRIASAPEEATMVREACLEVLATDAPGGALPEESARTRQELFIRLAKNDRSKRIQSAAAISFGSVADMTEINELESLLIDPSTNFAASTALWKIMQRHPQEAGRGMAQLAEFFSTEYRKHEMMLPWTATEYFCGFAVANTDGASDLALRNICASLRDLAEKDSRQEVRSFCRDAYEKLDIAIRTSRNNVAPDKQGE